MRGRLERKDPGAWRLAALPLLELSLPTGGATFGAVDDANAQPHVVRCHTFLYGAHNGNVTNCDELKGWLTERAVCEIEVSVGQSLPKSQIILLGYY